MQNHEYYIYYNNSDDEGAQRGIGCWIAIGIAVVLLFSIFGFLSVCVNTYNNLIDMEKDAKLAFANVQSVMQSRIEKIPDLVKVTDEVAEHLETIYADIDKGRFALSASSNPEELDAANAQITENINQFLAVIENYSTITESQQYTLRDFIEGVAYRINVARENYNVVVSQYNRIVRKFPGSLLANIFGFEVKESFETDEKS